MMFGTNYTGGYQPHPRHTIKRKFSYIPIKTSAGRWKFWSYYIEVTSGELVTSGEIGLAWKYERKKFTENEWLLESIKDKYYDVPKLPQTNPATPVVNTKSAVKKI